jgi:F-type H+-transporting ATPase subunit delta
MAIVSVARRYARALLELAKESDGPDAVQAQLEWLVEVIQSTPELADVLVNPVYTRAERRGVLEAVLQMQDGRSVLLANFIRLLVDRDRVGQLPDIARLYRDMADAMAGRVRGRVISAAPLQEESVRAIKTSLERLTDRQVLLESTVEPALLGGLKAQVGSTVYDGTLKTHLEELRRGLKQS